MDGFSHLVLQQPREKLGKSHIRPSLPIRKGQDCCRLSYANHSIQPHSIRCWLLSCLAVPQPLILAQPRCSLEILHSVRPGWFLPFRPLHPSLSQPCPFLARGPKGGSLALKNKETTYGYLHCNSSERPQERLRAPLCIDTWLEMAPASKQARQMSGAKGALSQLYGWEAEAQGD